MAEVTSPATLSAAHWTAAQTRAQFLAIARLRLSILRNGLRRKGGAGDLIANLVMIPLFLLIVFVPTAGVGIAAYFCFAKQQTAAFGALLWVIFAICQFTSIQLGQPGTTFDPTQLIRFPLNFAGYAAVRVFFGLVSPANIVGVLMSFAVAVGVTVAFPGMWFYAFVAMAAFALCNIFFTRMLFSWVDRWLSTRRAREVFTGAIFAFSIGVQYMNATFNPGFQHGRRNKQATLARVAAIKDAYHHVEPVLTLLPPGLTMNGIIGAQAGRLGLFAAGVLGTLLFTALFFTVFAIRLKKEFQGENLSDAANAVVTEKPSSRTAAAAASPAALSSHQALNVTADAPTRFRTPPTVSAVFSKEFLYLRRNTGMFYGLIAPLAMVIIFAGRLASHSSAAILFPAAVAYTMLGVAPLSYNSLGVEAAGIQFYFLAPVSMRDVFLGKNLFNVALASAEIVGVFAVVAYVASPPSARMTVAVLLWAAFTLLVSMAMGNYRSVTAPKKIEASKPGKQATPLSMLIGIGLLLVCSALGAGLLLAANLFSMSWLLLPGALLLAVLGFAVYWSGLKRMDGVLARKRDVLSEVLCKG